MITNITMKLLGAAGFSLLYDFNILTLSLKEISNSTTVLWKTRNSKHLLHILLLYQFRLLRNQFTIKSTTQSLHFQSERIAQTLRG